MRELWVTGVVPTIKPLMLKLEWLESKKYYNTNVYGLESFFRTFVGVRYMYIYLPLFPSCWGMLLMEA